VDGGGEVFASAGPLTLALSQEERGPEHGVRTITASEGSPLALTLSRKGNLFHLARNSRGFRGRRRAERAKHPRAVDRAADERTPRSFASLRMTSLEGPAT
jgi:hypothetical protein